MVTLLYHIVSAAIDYANDFIETTFRTRVSEFAYAMLALYHSIAVNMTHGESLLNLHLNMHNCARMAAAAARLYFW